jgi:CheY-like chemotaxis protein
LKTALIIDDDKDTLEILGYIINDMGLETINSLSLLPVSKIKDIAADIILLDHYLDLQIPGNLCFQIKSDPTLNHIPVVILSAHLNLANIAKDSLADAYLAKPFDINDLTDLIYNLIQ